MSPFVRVILVVFFPIAYPISKLLDWILGREEQKILVHLHANEAGKGGELSLHETTIIAGALDLTQKTAKDAMTAIGEAFSLDINSKLDMHRMALIMSKGHSRVPIYYGNPTNVVGLIVGENWPLYDILNQFQKGQSHMAVVIKSEGNIQTAATNAEGLCTSFQLVDCTSQLDASNQNSQETEYYSENLKNVMRLDNRRSEQTESSASFENLESLKEVIGIITLEDVMEELLQDDILDETDQYVDVHQNIRIKLQHPRRLSSSGSSTRSSTSPRQRRSSDASGLKFFHSYTCFTHF